MKLILADDDAVFREALAALLSQHDMATECCTVCSRDEVLALMQAHPDANAAVIDLNLPCGPDTAFLKSLLQRHPAVPLIVLAKTASRAQMESLLALGIAGYLPKSAPAPVMISAIRLVASGGIYLPWQMLSGQPGKIPRAKSCALTRRQLQVLRLIATGLPIKTICTELGLGESTVKAHLGAVYRALNVGNRRDAAKEADRLRLLDVLPDSPE